MAEPVDLTLKWRSLLDVVKPLNDWDTEGELAWLAEQASKATHVLEAGSFKGASTKIMALANPDAQFICLDDWADPGVFETFREALIDEIASGRVQLFRGNTTDGFLKIPEDFQPDFTFIDAGHLYPDVEHDIRMTLKIQKSGVIAGHDFRHDIPSDGVTKAAREAFGDKLEFPADSIWSFTIPEKA